MEQPKIFKFNKDLTVLHSPEVGTILNSIYFSQEYYDDDEEPYVDDYDEEDIKQGILEAALELVSTHGWTKSAIVAAAESYGYPGVAHGKNTPLELKRDSLPLQC